MGGRDHYGWVIITDLSYMHIFPEEKRAGKGK